MTRIEQVAALAEMLGWTVNRQWEHGGVLYLTDPAQPLGSRIWSDGLAQTDPYRYDHFDPFTRIQDAWLLVEKLSEQGLRIFMAAQEGHRDCQITEYLPSDKVKMVSFTSASMAETICNAALAWRESQCR